MHWLEEDADSKKRCGGTYALFMVLLVLGNHVQRRKGVVAFFPLSEASHRFLDSVL